jgi:hypothetical protein
MKQDCCAIRVLNAYGMCELIFFQLSLNNLIGYCGFQHCLGGNWQTHTLCLAYFFYSHLSVEDVLQ